MVSGIILYSAEFCPKCKILKEKMTAKNIPYTNIEGNECIQYGIDEVPILEINGERFDFVTANKKINEWN